MRADAKANQVVIAMAKAIEATFAKGDWLEHDRLRRVVTKAVADPCRVHVDVGDTELGRAL